jgi:hypothetical protein
MSRRLVVSAAAPLLVGVGGVFPVSVDPADQAAAEAAVAVFNERLTAAGWTSTGPFAQSAVGDEGEGSEFGPCLGGFERYLDYTDVHLDGETARAFSDDFELTGDDREDGVGEDGVGEDGIGEFGYAGAVVLTAEASAVVMFDEFVQRLGADATAVCMTGQLADAAPSDGPAVEIGVTNEGDLGVGVASARLDVAVTMDQEGNAYGTSATFAAARVDRSLVVVVAGGSGQAASELDPVAELAAVVDTLA